jgi:hypothetical protein
MRTKLRSKVTLLFMMLAVLIAVPGAAALAQDTGTTPAPTIQSDKADYAPGELVTLTGSGWQPGESVNIVVNDDVGQTWNRNVNVIADASGNITDQFNLPDWFVATYSVNATGASGAVATSSFTDGNVTLHPGPTADGVTQYRVTYDVWLGTSTTCGGTTHTSPAPTNPTNRTLTVTSPNNTNIPGFGGSTSSALLKSVTVLAPASAVTLKTFDHWTSGDNKDDLGGAVSSPACVTNNNDAGSGNLTDLYAHFKNAQQATSITQVSGSGTYGGDATLTAKLTQGANNLSGKIVEFKLRNNAVCDNDVNTALQACPTTDANGVATLNNVSLSGIDAGGPTGTGYEGAVSASFAGDASFSSSSGTGNLTVSKANTTTAVTCTGAPFTYTGSPLEPCSATVTGPGNLNQSLTVNYTNNTNVGTATASASYAGTANYNGSSDSETFTIEKAETTTTVSCEAGPFTYTGSAHTPCSAKVTGPGNLDQTLTVSYQDNVNAGTATASASYAGSDNYKASSDSETFTIEKASQTITFGTLSNKFVNAADFTVSATGGDSGNPVTFTSLTTGKCSVSGNTVHLVTGAVGTCTIQASQAGNANYNAAPDVQRSFQITYDFTPASGAGFLQPINYTAHQLSTGPDVSTFKAGSTVPTKFVLKDANGKVVQAASAPQWLTPTKGSATTQPVDETVYSEPATTGTTYQWTGTHYQYNWASPKNGSGYYWRIGVKLDDGQIYYVNISLR